jgi:AcrR family transcriptional regulator
VSGRYTGQHPRQHRYSEEHRSTIPDGVLTYLRVLGFPRCMSITGDRRTRRRQETIDEILDVALDLMAAEGVAALSLSAIARRLGMQPPSLYQYFPSKMAIYDALFQRGSEQLLATQRAARAAADGDILARLRAAVTAFCRWCMLNQVYSQLLFWRTAPGFEPSAEAFAPSLRSVADLRSDLRQAADAGLLDSAAASDEGIALYTSLISGLITQQLANEPEASFEKGRFTQLLPAVLDMFDARYELRGKP